MLTSFAHRPLFLFGLALLLLVPGCNARGGAREVEARPAATDLDADAVAQALPPRGIAWVIFGSDTVHAEIADTPGTRERGLMHRSELPDGNGMLFVYDESRIRSFWMRNTYIPLDIAFLDANLEIVDIRQMEPLSEELIDSARPTMFALEVPEGWFARHGIEVGSRARVVFGRR